MKNRKMITLRTKFICMLTAVVLLITLVIVLIGVLLYSSSIIGRYNETAYEAAKAVSRYFTDEELTEYAALAVGFQNGTVQEEEINAVMASSRYQELHNLLEIMRDSMNANDINICFFDIDLLQAYDAEADAQDLWNPLFYIMDSYYDEDYQMLLGDCGPIFPEYCEEIVHSYETGIHSDDYFLADGQFGNTTTALYPIVRNGSTVAFAAVEIPMETLTADMTNYILKMIAAAGAAAVILLILITLFLVKTMISPIKLVASEAENFVENNNQVSEKLGKIKTHDEIQTLSENLLKLETDINDYIENLTKITAEKERIGAELNVATQIQADMLPSIFPAFPERKEFDIYATMNPAKEVGGDFYDFFLVDDDHLAMVMADVSGKGVPAALFMVIAKTLIKNRTQMGGSPSEILAYVNEQLCEGNEAELFVTVWLGILEISTGKGVVANAGHEYPTIRRAGGSYELVKTRHSPAVATMEGIRFRQHEFELHPGDSLYVYTDGVPEATNAQDELFGTERMLCALNENPDASPEELLHTVKRHIDEFVGEAPQFDDVTMLGLTYFGKGG